MGQDNAERYLQKKYEMENVISANEKRVFESGDTDNRIFIESEEDLRDLDNVPDSVKEQAVYHLRFNRGPVWVAEGGKLCTRCPLCKGILSVTSIKNHLKHQHDKIYAHKSARLTDYVPRAEKGDDGDDESESDEKSKAVDVFDKMRRLKEDYPSLFESLTGEQLKLILEDE